MLTTLKSRNLVSIVWNVAMTAMKYTGISSSSAAASAFQKWERRADDYVYFNNQTINDLMKSNCLDSAVQVFEEMIHRDAVSYNLVIAGYACNGYPEKAFRVLKEMIYQGINENSSTFSSVLGVCNDAGFYQEGLQVHCRAVFRGFTSNLFIGSALASLYMRSRYPGLALQLFDEFPERNLATWNLVLRGFGEMGYSKELLQFFTEMKSDGIEANALTFCYAIRGCCCEEQFLDQGKQLHCQVIKLGWIESNLFVANALVDFYSSCGNLKDAMKSIEIIQVEDVISWNSIISAHAVQGFAIEALRLFTKMRIMGKNPSIRSFVGFLNLSSETQNLQFGEQIYGFVLKSGLEQRSIHLQSALIDMYGKCGEIESAVNLFEEIPERTLECCNSLMTSLLHCGIADDVIELFGLMVDGGVGLDDVTFSTTLKALSSSTLASLSSCELLHCSVIKSGFESNIVVACSLLDAYSRTGHIKLSRQIFDQILEPNLICFTSIISGYARNGMGQEALEMLEMLYQTSIKPDSITFLSVLTGCSHSGFVKEGLLVFESMKKNHGIFPDRRHYSCIVDLLGRAGMLEEAEELLNHAPAKGDPIVWSSLLRACRVQRNIQVGRRAAETLMELKPDDPAAYLQASGFYSEIGDFVLSEKIREIKAIMDIKRDFGCSSIEINSHNFSLYRVTRNS